jgi:hypothetical protein
MWRLRCVFRVNANISSGVGRTLTLLQVKLRDLDATNADGSKGREWTVRFDDVVAEVQQVRVYGLAVLLVVVI